MKIRKLFVASIVAFVGLGSSLSAGPKSSAEDTSSSAKHLYDILMDPSPAIKGKLPGWKIDQDGDNTSVTVEMMINYRHYRLTAVSAPKGQLPYVGLYINWRTEGYKPSFYDLMEEGPMLKGVATCGLIPMTKDLLDPSGAIYYSSADPVGENEKEHDEKIRAAIKEEYDRQVEIILKHLERQ